MAFAFPADFRARVLGLPRLLRQGGGGQGAALPGGQSEFRGHRPFVQGDDLRRVDWNIFARLDQLHVKEFGRGEAPEVLLLLDRSGSMLDAAGGKDRISRELTVALGFLGLVAGSEVVLCLPGEGGLITLGRWRGENRLNALFRTVENLEAPAGRTWLGSIERLPPRSAAGRAAFLLTDALVAPLPAAAFAALGRSDDAVVVVVSADAERHLEEGRYSIQGAEGEAPFDATVDSNLQNAYLAALTQHEEDVSVLARAHRVGCVHQSDAQPFEHAVQHCARRGGVLA
ncbi:MAG: DUF58 domain-containing protein [Planctomycetes bacterium]|nr:DUF58 domain-containing protein [Planctomycetota bacterium]